MTLSSEYLLISLDTTYSKDFTATDESGALIDLTGYSVYFVARDFDEEVIFEYTEADSQITVSLPNTVTLTLPYSETRDYTFIRGKYQLYVESAGGVRTRISEGMVHLSRTLTNV